MVKKLSDAFDDMVISTPLKHSLNGHLHVSFPGIDAERIIYGLEMKGVLVATGSACAANRDTKSHVLEAIKMSDNLIAGSLRISLGKLNNAENIAQACEIIIDVIKSEYQRINNA
jgi:cysteine desulfurase